MLGRFRKGVGTNCIYRQQRLQLGGYQLHALHVPHNQMYERIWWAAESAKLVEQRDWAWCLEADHQAHG